MNSFRKLTQIYSEGSKHIIAA